MRQGDLPTDKDHPDGVENGLQDTGGTHRFNFDLFTERGQGGNAQFDGLHTKGDTDDGETDQQPAHNIAHPSDETTEDKPEDVPK